MITIDISNLAPSAISQKSYDTLIASLNLSTIQCPCGHKDCLVHHGTYRRAVKTPSGQIQLCICRVKCNKCGHTHAILPSSVVPYSQIPIQDQFSIITCCENKSGYSQVLSANLSLDEENIRSVIRCYRKHWRQKILSYNLLFCNLVGIPLIFLINQSFHLFGRQFMQVKSISNSLITIPT